MSYELLYTSAPKGLKPLSRGFCTVLCSEDMPRDLMDRLEALSGYRPVFPPEHEKNNLNPVAFSHVVLDLQGQEYSVVSRVADYGIDYTNRNNKLADHRAVLPNERPAGGPSWLLQRPDLMRTQWSGSPTRVPAGLKVPQGDRAIRICEETKLLTGDAGWAGVLAEAFLQNPKQAVYLTFEPGIDPLPLISEALSLIPVEKRWEVTFSTYYGNLPSNVQCLWRCVLKDSAEWQASQRSTSGLRIDLCSPMPKAVGGPLVTAAREGVLPAVPSPPKKKTGAAPSIPRATNVTQSEASPVVDFTDFEAFEEHEKFIEHRASREKDPVPKELNVPPSSGFPVLPPMPPPRPRVEAAKPKGSMQSVFIGAGSGLVVLLVGIGAFVMLNQEALEQGPSVAVTQPLADPTQGGTQNDSLEGSDESSEGSGERPSDGVLPQDSTGRFNPPPFVDRPKPDTPKRMENKDDVPVVVEEESDKPERKEENPKSSKSIPSRLANVKLKFNRVQLTPKNKSNSSIVKSNGSNEERTKLPSGEQVKAAVRLFFHPPVESAEKIHASDVDGKLSVTIEKPGLGGKIVKVEVATIHWDSETQEIVWSWKDAEPAQKALVEWSVVELATSKKSFLFAKPSPMEEGEESEFTSQWNLSSNAAKYSGDFPRLHAADIKINFGIKGLEALLFEPVEVMSVKDKEKTDESRSIEVSEKLHFQCLELEKYIQEQIADSANPQRTKFPVLELTSHFVNDLKENPHPGIDAKLIHFKSTLGEWETEIDDKIYRDLVNFRDLNHRELFCERLQKKVDISEEPNALKSTAEEIWDKLQEGIQKENLGQAKKIYDEAIKSHFARFEEWSKVKRTLDDGVPFKSIRLYYEVRGQDGVVREVDVVNLKE